MNDAIVRLMNEAKIIDPAIGAIMHVKRENFQKFAELIVAECVSIAQSADDNSWKPDGKGTEIAKNIQQHFGIK